MAGWTCTRCGASNDDVGVTCSRCGSSRGSVVIPGGPAAEPTPPASAIESGWQAPTSAPIGVGGEPAPPAPVPFWRRIPLGLALFAGLIAIGAVSSWFFSASRSESGEITRSGDLDVNDLRVGDCFDLKDQDTETIDTVAARPCTEEHEFETFYITFAPGFSSPGADAYEAEVARVCGIGFIAYVGIEYELSRLEMSWFEPTVRGPAGSDSIQCILRDPTTPRLTTSVKRAKI